MRLHSEKDESPEMSNNKQLQTTAKYLSTQPSNKGSSDV